MKSNIVLIGFMGSGKSLVANRLESRLKREVVSTDELIIQAEGKAISEIFEDSGEDYFRQLEKRIVAEIVTRDHVIIDCGGGIILDPDNVARLKEKGILFYLSASPALIYENIKDQHHRPLLKTENPLAKIEELLQKRKPLYEKADYTIDTHGKTMDEVSEEIVRLIS